MGAELIILSIFAFTIRADHGGLQKMRMMLAYHPLNLARYDTGLIKTCRGNHGR
jgi:hypothetical protein